MMFNVLLCAILAVGCVTISQLKAEDEKKRPETAITVTFNKWQDFTVRPDNFKKVKEDETCETGMFKGNRYMRNNDPTTILIYNAGDKFVGSQFALKQTEVQKVVRTYSEEWYQWFEKNPEMTKEDFNGETYYVMTIYKEDPEKICSSTEPAPDDFLYVLHDKTYLVVNRKDEKALVKDGWVRNSCIDKMGYHYRLHVGGVDWDCLKELTPIFFYVKDGFIIGHGWNFPSAYSSDDIELFPYDYVSKVVVPSPKCILEVYNQTLGFSAQHMYYVKKEYAEAILCTEETTKLDDN